MIVADFVGVIAQVHHLRLWILSAGILASLVGCQSAHYASVNHRLANLTASEEKAGKELGELLQARETLLETPEGTNAQQLALAEYNRELKQFFLAFYGFRDEREWGEEGFLLTDSQGRRYRLHFSKQEASKRGVLTEHLRDVRLAEDIPIPRLIWGEAAKSEGAGIALVAKYADAALGSEQEFAPEDGFYQALTALIDLPQAPSHATGQSAAPTAEIPVVLHLFDAQEQSSAELGQRSFALERNLSAPLPVMLKRGLWDSIGLQGLFNPETDESRRSLFQLSRGSADKVPIVFVHGLGSHPMIWRRAINAIMADPLLQEQYQVLYFAYPTGMPMVASAASLRKQFALWRQRIDPLGKGIASKHAIFVGHSMGGLISRMQVIDSGEHFREAFFQVPLEEMEGLPTEVAQNLQESLYFKANDNIDSVVFFAVPHRGSELAQLGLVDLALQIAQLPAQVLENLTSESIKWDRWKNPELNQFRGSGIDGVSQLEPGHPFYEALNAPEIQVPHHSIIGKAQLLLEDEKSNDLVVPYESSHLDTASSEDLIFDWHLLTENPQAVAALSRILRDYAKDLPDAR